MKMFLLLSMLNLNLAQVEVVHLKLQTSFEKMCPLNPLLTQLKGVPDILGLLNMLQQSVRHVMVL